MSDVSEKKYLSMREASDYLTSIGIPCKPDTLRKWTSAGLVKCIRFPRPTSRPKYTKELLDAALEKATTTGRAQWPVRRAI